MQASGAPHPEMGQAGGRGQAGARCRARCCTRYSTSAQARPASSPLLELWAQAPRVTPRRCGAAVCLWRGGDRSCGRAAPSSACHAVAPAPPDQLPNWWQRSWLQTVYTIGHSSRTVLELVALLRQQGVRLLVDVRTNPRSRSNPQHNREALSAEMPAHGIRYRWHGRELGGLRSRDKALGDLNAGWDDPAFQGASRAVDTAATVASHLG